MGDRATDLVLHNGCLTYPGANSLFRNWQPDTPFLYELLFATITTCLVYQLTKICLDLGLGQRSRGRIRISDLNIIILVSNFSLRSIFSSFGCRGFVAKRRFHGEEKPCSEESPISRSIGYPVFAKLAILLIAAPGIHMLGIFLSIERDRHETFGDVDFGGLALGLNDKGPVIDKSSGFYCPRICTSYARGEVPLTQFYRCSIAGSFPFQNNLQNGTFILILRSSLLDIGFTVVTPGRRWISILFLDIHTGKTPHRLRNTLTEEERNNIFERALQQTTQSCAPEIRRGVNISAIIPPAAPSDPTQWILSAQVTNCDNYIAEDVEEIALSMLDGVTTVRTGKLEISKEQNDTFTPGENLDLLLRRTSTASLFSMLIATVIAIVVRSIIRLVLHNEGHVAVETVVKDTLQMKCCDSLLQSENTVSYRDGIEVMKDEAADENFDEIQEKRRRCF